MRTVDVTKPKPQTARSLLPVYLLRAAGAIVGLAFVAMAPFVEVPVESALPGWLGTASLALTGAYFLFYALTGRSSIFRSLGRQQSHNPGTPDV